MENEKGLSIEEKIATNLHPTRCPECDEVITYLYFTQVQERAAKFVIHADGQEEYYDWNLIDTLDDSEHYFCPECERELHDISFLKGEEEPVLEENGSRREDSCGATSAEVPTMWERNTPIKT